MQPIRRGLGYLRPYLRFALGAFLSTLIVTALSLVTPQIISYLIDEGIDQRQWNPILIAGGGLLLIALLRGVFSFTNAFWSETASQSVAYDLRDEIFRKLENLSFSYHDGHQTGQLMTRATSDVEGVRTFFAQGIFQLISAILTFIGSIVILFLTDATLALASLATIPFIIAIFFFIFSRMGPLFGEVQRNLGQLNNILQENITGVRVVKAFAAEPREHGRYTAQNTILYEKNLSVVKTFSLGFPTIFFLSNIGTLIVIWFGGNRVISDQLSLGSLIAFNSYLAFLLQPIFQLGFLSQQVARAQASGKRIFDVIDAENEVADAPDAYELPEDITGQVTFENVHFHYTGKDDATLDNVSFVVEAGQRVALIGRTGSGKSTIVNLLPRFYNPTEGRILIDGHDLGKVTLESLRHRIGVVLQDVRLVKGTVADNIRFGVTDASDESVEFVAKLAQADEFIAQLSNGYETDVGERGAGLSGGQRQRIAIARTLLTRPKLLILDDAMSAIDAETEANLQHDLDEIIDRYSVTTFVVAQRISTVRNADLILVIENGNIVAQGTHEQLLHESPEYADIVHSQLTDNSGEVAA